MFEDERKGQLDIEALEKARAEGKRIGLVMGSFDQCHLGHIRYLKRAKEECDYLIVGVDSDAKIRKRKGANRPLIPEEERLDTIMELGVNKVKTYEPGKSLADDIVYKGVDEKKWELIKLVKPDVLVAIPENYTMEENDEDKLFILSKSLSIMHFIICIPIILSIQTAYYIALSIALSVLIIMIIFYIFCFIAYFLRCVFSCS